MFCTFSLPFGLHPHAKHYRFIGSDLAEIYFPVIKHNLYKVISKHFNNENTVNRNFFEYSTTVKGFAVCFKLGNSVNIVKNKPYDELGYL